MASRYWRFASWYWRIAGVADAVAASAVDTPVSGGTAIRVSSGEDRPGRGRVPAGNQGRRRGQSSSPCARVDFVRTAALQRTETWSFSPSTPRTQAGSLPLRRDGALVGERAGDAERAACDATAGRFLDLLRVAGVPLEDVDAVRRRLGPGRLHRPARRHRHDSGPGVCHGRPVVGVSALEALAQPQRRRASGRSRCSRPGWTRVAGRCSRALYRRPRRRRTARVHRGAGVASPRGHARPRWARGVSGRRVLVGRRGAVRLP